MSEHIVITRMFEDDGVIPNNPLLPVVILKAALDPAMSAEEIRALHRANGWGGGWTYTVFDLHHWHPDAHEALSVASGRAAIRLGGPQGETFAVTAGDSLILPAGTGHCRLSSSADFAVCGCYPPGQESYSTRRGNADERGDGPAEVRRVPLPVSDPIFGGAGELGRLWGFAV